MNATSLIVVAHVLSAFWLVTGIVARDVSFRRAGRAKELGALMALVELGRLFERRMVRPATFVVIGLGLVAAWLRGYPILGFLQGRGPQWVLVSWLLVLSVVPFIVLVLLPRGRIFRAALAQATERGEVTPELRAALQDPAVDAARHYEVAMTAVVIWLMVAKPF